MNSPVVPIRFPQELIDKLRAEAKAEGLMLSAYLKHLIVTHPKRSGK